MSPYPVTTHPSEDELLVELGEPEKPAQPELPRPASRLGRVILAPRGRDWLAEAMLDMSPTRPTRRTWDFFMSLIVHTLLVATALLLPLYFTEAINLKEFTQTLLVAPPPPPPPPPRAAAVIVKSAAPKRVLAVGGRLIAPTVIPQRIAMIKEEPLPPEIGATHGVLGGVPGGVPGGQIGGVIGGIISGAQRTYVPAPPAPSQPKAPIRVGGRVKAPRPIFTPDPIYPPVAKAARIQGEVIVDAIIDKEGNVVEAKVLSGHPMLITAALQAVSRWKYAPTILNDEPVAVQLVVKVQFRLN